MKKGLNLLNTRNTKENIDLNFLNFELIPESFKLFVSNYELGYNLLNISKVNINQNLEFFVVLSMFNEEVLNDEFYTATIDYIFDFPELNIELENYLNKTEKWNELGFMKIGLLFHGDVLLLGLSKDYIGQIWRYGSGMIKTQYCKLDNNIFDFFTRLKESLDYDQLGFLKINEDSLYKNWNEDFWRIG